MFIELERRKPTSVTLKWVARETARLEGAETAHTIPMPAAMDFWRISKLVRPDTIRMVLEAGRRDSDRAQPISLSTALWRPTSSRAASRSPVAVNMPAACKPPVRMKTAWAHESRSGSWATVERATSMSLATGGDLIAIAARDDLPHTPQLDEA